jgi:hypothetical protein
VRLLVRGLDNVAARLLLWRLLGEARWYRRVWAVLTY